MTHDDTPPPPPPPTPPRAAVLAFRMFLFAVAASAAAAGVVIFMHGRSERAAAAAAAAARFVCPMHPEVLAAAPGTCPICRMALEPARGGPQPARPHAAMEGMADVIAVENIRKHNILEFVHSRSLLLPASERRGAAWVPTAGEDLAGQPVPAGTVAAVFYDDQLPWIPADEDATFWLGDAPATVVTVRRTDDPPRRWDDSTSVITFRAAPATAGAPARAPAPRPGQVGWVELPRKRRVVLTVSASALIQSPEGPYVLVVHPGWRFEKRPVRIGETFLKYGFAVVLSGLTVSERVVARATFFVDADRRLAAGPALLAEDGKEQASP